jgi:hypothetical protein
MCPPTRAGARVTDVRADEPTATSPAHGRRNQPINRQRRRRNAAPPYRPKGQQPRITVTGNPKPDPDLDLLAQALVAIGRDLDTRHQTVTTVEQAQRPARRLDPGHLVSSPASTPEREVGAASGGLAASG